MSTTGLYGMTTNGPATIPAAGTEQMNQVAGYINELELTIAGLRKENEQLYTNLNELVSRCNKPRPVATAR